MLKKITFFVLLLCLIVTPAYAMEKEEKELPDINILKFLKEDIIDESLKKLKEINTNDSLNKKEEVSQEKTKTYTVKKGDTLYRIALNHEINLDDLFKWNQLESDLIFPGDVLYVSKPSDDEIKKLTAKKEKKKKVAAKEKNQQSKKVAAFSQTEPQNEGKELIVTATAYTAYCDGCTGTTAYGIDLRKNPNQKVIAVDPNIIPLGTKVWVEGYGVAIAGDTGGAIKGNKIDVFIPSYEDAMEWGVKKVKIKILE